MRQALFIAWNDAKIQIRQGSTLLWLLVMPPIFFYFIGSVTSGFSSTASGSRPTPVTVIAESPGFLKEQVDHRLRANNFETDWVDHATLPDAEPPIRTLTIGANLSDEVTAGNEVLMSYETKASALTRELEEIRVQRALYTTLADIVVATAESGLTTDSLDALNRRERPWTLEVSPAGDRQTIPTGFEQAIPGILVMFTLLVLLTSGGSLLVIERNQGLLRRLASAPMTRGEVVAGKWGGRMLLAFVQIAVALTFGTFLFDMAWGPDFAMVLVVLVAWAGFCASAGLLLGSVAKTEGQAAGLGVLAANGLAALGGCWWPIEVTPGWMQAVQQLTPTGWTMDALHKLISFQSGATSALPEVLTLAVATVVVGAFAVRQFRFQ